MFLETVRIHPHGLIGDVDIQVAIEGYDKEVLMSAGAALPTEDIPSPPEPFSEDYDDEDYDYDDDGNFIVTSKSNGIADEISLTFGTDSSIDLVYDDLRQK